MAETKLRKLWWDTIVDPETTLHEKLTFTLMTAGLSIFGLGITLAGGRREDFWEDA